MTSSGDDRDVPSTASGSPHTRTRPEAEVPGGRRYAATGGGGAGVPPRPTASWWTRRLTHR